MTEAPQHLYLVRHGQTVLNAQDRLRGLADPELDDIGAAQAERVAQTLCDRGIGAVYSSPLVRASTTARVIAERLGVAMHLDERVNDRDYGPWTGHSRKAIVDEFGSVDAAPGVEPRDAVIARVRPALDALLDAERGTNVAVVSHDAVIGPVLVDMDPTIDPSIPTGSWSDVTRAGNRWTVVSVGNRD